MALDSGKECSGFRVCMREYAYHLFFGVALLSMAALVIWWSVYLRQTVYERHRVGMEMLKITTAMHATMLGNNNQAPALGTLFMDDRFEIRACVDSRLKASAPASPLWRDYCVQARADVVETLDRKFKRQRIMVIGESSLLVFLLFVSVFMLYRSVRTERRFHRQMEDMFSAVTHELKTPIAGIKALLQTLQAGKVKQEEIVPLASVGVHEIDRQEHLIENLLQNQRIRYRPESISSEPLKVRVLLERLFEHRSVTGGKNPFKLKCVGDPVVLADVNAVEVIFENLLDNAAKYGAKNIKVNVEEMDNHIAIHVIDDGRGFDPKDAEMIFRPYQRIVGSRKGKQHGSGLGLYISRQLARKMNGNLTASSKGVEKGSRFSLSLRRK